MKHLFRFFSAGTVLAHYADILGVLLRLRQLCCHPNLCINTSSSSFSAGEWMLLVPVFLITGLALCIQEQKHVCVFCRLCSVSLPLFSLDYWTSIFVTFIFFFHTVIHLNMFEKWVLEHALKYGRKQWSMSS